MPALRITQSIMTNRVLRNLNTHTREILHLQDQLSTGRRVVSPSDNPINARRALSLRTLISNSQQYLDNISAISPQFQETSTSIETIYEYGQRARELALQAANGTYGPEQLNNIAAEIDQLLEGVLLTANHTTNGRYIFGGTRTDAPPYVATRDAGGQITSVGYVGNNEAIRMAVSDNATMAINEPGPSALQGGGTDIFQTLIDLRDNLRAGNQNSIRDLRLVELDQISDQAMGALARIGAKQNRLERLTTEFEDFILQYEEQMSNQVDADFADVVVSLNAQSNAYQAALSAAAQVIQPSLLNFLS